MARFNELLVGRYNRYIQKLLSMKGAATLESVNPELQVILATFHGVENRLLEGWDSFALSGIVAAAAGNSSAAALRNPVGSNIIAVITKASASGGAAATEVDLSGFSQTGDLVTVLVPTGHQLDRRASRLNSTLIPSQQNAAGTTNLSAVFEKAQTNSSSFDFIVDSEQQIMLLPGDAVQLTNQTVNQNLLWAWRWRERFLEDSERSG